MPADVRTAVATVTDCPVLTPFVVSVLAAQRTFALDCSVTITLVPEWSGWPAASSSARSTSPWARSCGVGRADVPRAAVPPGPDWLTARPPMRC